MEKVHVYLHHQGFDFYLSDQELSPTERFCKTCGEEDMLVGAYDTENALAEKLAELFTVGYDLLPCKEYDIMKEKYCPAELRQ